MATNSKAPSEATPDPATEEDDDSPTLRTYWLMIVERRWYALAVFAATVLAATTYTFITSPIYQAVATVEILKRGAQILRAVDIVESSVTSDADFNTQIGILESRSVVDNLVKQLSAEELEALTAPFRKRNLSPAAIIISGRMIAPQRTSLITSVVFRHPDPKIAARVTNLIAREFIAYSSKVRVDESLKAIDDLKDRADQQRRHVEELANSMAAYRQRGNLVSLVQTKDIVTERLKVLNIQATEAGTKMKSAEIRWNQIQQWRRDGKDLSNLPFMGSQPAVSQIVQQITAQKLALANLRQTYKAKHPRMVEALNALDEAERQLQTALDSAAESVKAEYDAARDSDEAARKALSDQQAESLNMDKLAVSYDNMSREFHVNEQLLEAMMSRMREAAVTSSIDTQNARIIDAAETPSMPISPNIKANLAIGVVAGLLLGLGTAYLLSMLADQIKSAFDVESIVGLPLIAGIPRTERMDQPDKAQIVSNGADPKVVEAFFSLYSNLRLAPESRDARRIMVTSTLPGEGKSFVATNLALAFAAQGLRTVIVDCDLRKPNIHTSFRLRSPKGVITVCTRGVTLDEVLIRNVQPNLDVITSGGRTKNPIQLFGTSEFEQLVEDLSRRYDKIIFDTPPLGAVSDALNLLHLMDGVVYTIRYNHVMRRAARRCVLRLASTNTPVFGAVLNDMEARVSREYYVEYHSDLVKEYYQPASEPTDASGRGNS